MQLLSLRKTVVFALLFFAALVLAMTAVAGQTMPEPQSLPTSSNTGVQALEAAAVTQTDAALNDAYRLVATICSVFVSIVVVFEMSFWHKKFALSVIVLCMWIGGACFCHSMPDYGWSCIWFVICSVVSILTLWRYRKRDPYWWQR